jgi:hypothetical protein
MEKVKQKRILYLRCDKYYENLEQMNFTLQIHRTLRTLCLLRHINLNVDTQIFCSDSQVTPHL